mgnify:CR=1 FL=1
MRKKLVLDKLEQVEEEEWLVVLEKARKHIEIRIKGRTKYGAHSEENLGMDAIDCYVGETIKRLYEGIRDWKFETRSLEVEFIRIIDSIISEEVRKIKDKPEDATKIISVDPDSFLIEDVEQSEENVEKLYEEQVTTIFDAISGDEVLEEIFLLIHDGKTYDEIAKKLDIPKSKIYRAVDKIKRKVKSNLI